MSAKTQQTVTFEITADDILEHVSEDHPEWLRQRIADALLLEMSGICFHSLVEHLIEGIGLDQAELAEDLNW